MWPSAAWKVGLPARPNLVPGQTPLWELVLVQTAQCSGKERDGLGINPAAATRLCPGVSSQVLASSSLGYHPQLPAFPGSLSQGLGCPQDALLVSCRKGTVNSHFYVELYSSESVSNNDAEYLCLCPALFHERFKAEVIVSPESVASPRLWM